MPTSCMTGAMYALGATFTGPGAAVVVVTVVTVVVCNGGSHNMMF